MKSHVPPGTALQKWLNEAKGTDPAALTTARWEEPEDLPSDYLGWELARCAPGLPPEDARALASLASACVAAMLGGSTRLPIDRASLEATLGGVGSPSGCEAARRLLDRAKCAAKQDAVAQVIGAPGERKPLILDDGYLYLERMRLLEQRFCDRVRALVARKKDPTDRRAVRRAVASVSSGAQRLTREQQSAVEQGLSSTLALITGAPGTGKTATIVALVRAAAWLGIAPSAIAVAAPTGKAAQRLGEAIAAALATGGDIADEALRQNAPVPVTLHRLLGWSPTAGRFSHHEGHPLSHRLVIVDEASMVDLAMMDRLLRALPETGRLVLVGDSDQLPSVEAGAVFRDLCSALSASRLTANLRVLDDVDSQSIVASARAINAGTWPLPMTERQSVADVEFRGVEYLDARWSAVGDPLLDRWWRSRVASGEDFGFLVSRAYRRQKGVFGLEDASSLATLFRLYGSARLFVATLSSGFPASVEAITRSLLGRLAGRAASSWSPQRPGVSLPAGCPVLLQQNDYARDLFNGDRGLILDVQSDERDPEPMLVVARGKEFEALPIGSHMPILPSFAMTVHKAQGSEFDYVALILPDEDHPILTRELVYTAITRARRAVLVVGPAEVLRRAVSRTTLRSSGVAHRLEASGAAGAYALAQG